MSRGNYSSGKREREAKKLKKKREKAERRRERRELGPAEIEVTTAEEMLGELPSVEEVMESLQNPDSRPRESHSPPCRLFVGGLSWDTTTESLREAFQAYGTVTDAAVIRDRATGQSRGFGFVTMESSKVANQAIEALDQSELDGRSILVKVATERER